MRIRDWSSDVCSSDLKVPASPLLEGHPITLRGILSHSAGLVPGGYGGYSHDEPVPTLIPTLSGAKPARPKPVQVAYVPGSGWRYSGGGYPVAQLFLTQKNGANFDTINHDEVLAPRQLNQRGLVDPFPNEKVV